MALRSCFGRWTYAIGLMLQMEGRRAESGCVAASSSAGDPCFLRYDEEHSVDDKVFLDCFCKIAAGIKNNSNGHLLKDLILQRGITQNALDYMKKHIPSAKK